MTFLKGAVKRKFTERELTVVQLLCGECLTVKSIALVLHLSVKTVETHKSNIHRKIGSHSMAQLCREYWRRFYEEAYEEVL